jgi:glycosyltransferase involved in cell wall biosynthesis
MTINQNSVSVVMITMDEEGAVATVINDIQRIMPGAEILVVDSSRDGTAEIATAAGAHVIKQYPPKGYGPAMDLALRSAQGDVIITLDCDGSYPVTMIPPFADYVLKNGYDLVDGARTQHKPEAMPWINYLGNRAFGLLATILFFRWLPDLHSGMRAYRRTLIHSLRYNNRGPALPVELLLRPLKEGYRVKTAYIDYHQRIGASKMRPLQSAWWTIKRIMRVRFS